MHAGAKQLLDSRLRGKKATSNEFGTEITFLSVWNNNDEAYDGEGDCYTATPWKRRALLHRNADLNGRLVYRVDARRRYRAIVSSARRASGGARRGTRSTGRPGS